ncbi:MAG: N-6 DNA methylase [Clostridiales bacterium]|jgi:type I restriction enzyme M protein|nr:N-6 DNA methylase [Clostridiales bacterium]
MTQNFIIASERKVGEFAEQLAACLKGCGKLPNDYSAHMMSAYALHRAQSDSPDSMPAFKAMLESIKGDGLIRRSVAAGAADCWEALKPLYGVYSQKTLAAYILNAEEAADPRRECPATPDSVAALALELMKISDYDAVADFGAGAGGFLVSAFKENGNAAYYGIEINGEMAAIAAVRAELLGPAVTVEQGNMFSLGGGSRKFNKIFSNYPFGFNGIKECEPFVGQLKYRLPKYRSMDWIYNLLLLESLSAGGKAIAVMTSGACINGADREMRELFVKSGFIEAIIALPPRMFPETNVSTEMVVLSKGNACVKLVDAKKWHKNGRRQSEFTDGDIRKIAAALKTDSECGRTAAPAELERLGFILDPAKHLEKPVEIANGVPFGDVIKRITRGAQLSAEALDELSSSEPTGFQYLMLRDIQDGMISGKLPYLKRIEPRLEKYCVSQGNLLLSKNGSPFRAAVVGDLSGKAVLANGNLYVIELDESRVKPHYLKAFFESVAGMKALNGIAVGTAMPMLQIEALKSIIIPCPPLDEQEALEKRYLESVEAISSLRGQLASAIKASRSVFKESGWSGEV